MSGSISTGVLVKKDEKAVDVLENNLKYTKQLLRSSQSNNKKKFKKKKQKKTVSWWLNIFYETNINFQKDGWGVSSSA